MKILIVDDSGFDLRLADEIISSLGYRTYLADSGEQAISFFETIKPDLVIIDLVMPGIGGLEAIKKIRRMPAERWLPILLVSGFVEDASLVEALLAGADDFLQKPVRNDFLSGKVNSLLCKSNDLKYFAAFGHYASAIGDGGHLGELLRHEYENALIDMFKHINPHKMSEELQLYFQPLVDAESYRIVFIDTTPRWKHPVLEQLGYIREYNELILRKVSEMIFLFRNYLHNIKILIQVSVEQIMGSLKEDHTPCFAEEIASDVVLVFSANSLMPSFNKHVEMFDRLHSLGFYLCLDNVSEMTFESEVPDSLGLIKLDYKSRHFKAYSFEGLSRGKQIIVDHVDSVCELENTLLHRASCIQGGGVCKAVSIQELGGILRGFSSRSRAGEIS